MVDYWSRLKPEMDAKGVTKAALSRKLGISYQAIKKVVDGGAFGVENNFKAARLLGLSPEWLSSGKGPKNAPAFSSASQTEGLGANYPNASRANTLTEHMVALEIALDALPDLLKVSGRDVLSKWVRGEIDARKAAGDLDELATMAGWQPRPLGAPVAAEHLETIQRLSDEAEARDGEKHAKKQRRRTAA